jgi:hypothetical protein
MRLQLGLSKAKSVVNNLLISGIDELNDGHKDDSPGPKYNMSEMGTKTSLSGFTTGKSHRS